MHSVVTVLGPTSPVYDLTTVEAVNAELNLTSDTANDAEVAGQITAASRIIATECDRTFALQEVSERFHVRYHEHMHALPLSCYPVVLLTSVTINSVLLDSINYELDARSGLLWRLNHGHWHGDITALYQGGYDLPDDAEPSLARACVELVKTQRVIATRDPGIRDIQHGETRVSFTDYYQRFGITGSGASSLPPSVAGLIEPFKRRGA